MNIDNKVIEPRCEENGAGMDLPTWLWFSSGRSTWLGDLVRVDVGKYIQKWKIVDFTGKATKISNMLRSGGCWSKKHGDDLI